MMGVPFYVVMADYVDTYGKTQSLVFKPADWPALMSQNSVYQDRLNT
jgi:hypothetical protein